MSSVTKKEKEAKELKDLLLYTQQQVPNLSSQCFLLEKAGDIQNSVKNSILYPGSLY